MPIQPGGNPQVFNGSVTSPAGAGTIVSTGTLPLGLYRVQIKCYIDGTVAAATDDDNVKLTINSSGISGKVLSVPSNGQIAYYDFYAEANNVTVATAAAGSVGSIYHANIVVTPQQVG